MQKINDKNQYRLNENTIVQTMRGRDAIVEAIEKLNKKKEDLALNPLTVLKYSNEMEEASKVHVQEIGNNGIISHDSFNMDVKQRLEAHGNG